MTRELGGEQRDERQVFTERMASGMDATERSSQGKAGTYSCYFVGKSH